MLNGVLRPLIAAITLVMSCWASAAAPSHGSDEGVLAIVDGVTITTAEFDAALATEIRQKFYHRRPPEGQLAALQDEVAQRMVDRVLLLREAQRRGIRAEEEKVAAEISAYDKKYRGRPQWQENRAQIMESLVRALREKNILAQLESATRTAPPPDEDALRAYYAGHLESFTEPERIRLSMILLKVDPSSPPVAWSQAQERAQELIKQLANGTDFAELARRHSEDSTAPDGGDLGYLHRGMMPAGVEGEIDKMAIGTTSEPLRLLEGFAIFRLAERKPAQLRQFEAVRRNAADLMAREQGEAQWRELLTKLRSGAQIRFGSGREGEPANAVGGGSSAR